MDSVNSVAWKIRLFWVGWRVDGFVQLGFLSFEVHMDCWA